MLVAVFRAHSTEPILHVNASILSSVNLWVWNCLKSSEFGHTDVVSMKYTDSSFVFPPVTVIRSAEDCDNLKIDSKVLMKYYVCFT